MCVEFVVERELITLLIPDSGNMILEVDRDNCRDLQKIQVDVYNDYLRVEAAGH